MPAAAGLGLLAVSACGIREEPRAPRLGAHDPASLAMMAVIPSDTPLCFEVARGQPSTWGRGGTEYFEQALGDFGDIGDRFASISTGRDLEPILEDYNAAIVKRPPRGRIREQAEVVDNDLCPVVRPSAIALESEWFEPSYTLDPVVELHESGPCIAVFQRLLNALQDERAPDTSRAHALDLSGSERALSGYTCAIDGEKAARAHAMNLLEQINAQSWTRWRYTEKWFSLGSNRRTFALSPMSRAPSRRDAD